jgi:hypothetical protein
MKKTILAATMVAVCGDILAMDIPPIDLSVPWQDREKFFDIAPVYEARMAELRNPNARAFVEHIANAEIEECTDLAEQYFQTRSDEDSKKCMELLALTAGWPSRRGLREVTRRIRRMCNEEEIALKNFEYREFCGDILYMGLHRTFKKNADGAVDLKMFKIDKAEFFRELSNMMYSSVPGKTFADRKHKCYIRYSTTPGWCPRVVWTNWWGRAG